MQKTSFILVTAIVLLFKNDLQCNAQHHMHPIQRDQLLNGRNATFVMLNCDCSSLQCDLADMVQPSSHNKCLFFCCPINAEIKHNARQGPKPKGPKYSGIKQANRVSTQ